MTNMNIIYLGAFPTEALIKKSGGKIDSYYRDYCALIDGLKKVNDVCLDIVTSPDIISYPKGPFFISHACEKEDCVITVSSLNIPLLKQAWTVASMFIECSKLIKNKDDKVAIIIPYIVFRHVLTLRILKFFFPKRIIQVCVVPDIFFPNGLLAKFVNKCTERMARRFDCFILYTKKMAEYLSVSKGRFIVIEGFKKIPLRKPVKMEGFNVVYTGSLNKKYGIVRLLNSMTYIRDEDLRLHLYGRGDSESIIKDACKIDSRIVYHGNVSKEEAINAIYSANALINPRNSFDGEFTEYSFPSKDIEYLGTGIPTLLCKLPGMPEEYYGHFIDIVDALPSQIADGIHHLRSMSENERLELGGRAKRFIINRMNIYNQASSIIELIKQTKKIEL